MDVDGRCSRHQNETYVCDACHRKLTQPIIWTNDTGEIKIMCRQCFSQM